MPLKEASTKEEEFLNSNSSLFTSTVTGDFQIFRLAGAVSHPTRLMPRCPDAVSPSMGRPRTQVVQVKQALQLRADLPLIPFHHWPISRGHWSGPTTRSWACQVWSPAVGRMFLFWGWSLESKKSTVAVLRMDMDSQKWFVRDPTTANSSADSSHRHL